MGFFAAVIAALNVLTFWLYAFYAVAAVIALGVTVLVAVAVRKLWRARA